MKEQKGPDVRRVGHSAKRGNSQRPSRARPKRQRHISVRSIQRDAPDLSRLARALTAVALAEAELEAQSQAQTAAEVHSDYPPTSSNPDPGFDGGSDD